MQIDRPITIAITFFIIILLMFFLVVPEYNQFKDLQQTLGEKKAERTAKFDYYNTISAAYNEIQLREASIKKIDDALPSDSSLGRLIYYIQKDAKENGIIIKNIFLSKASSAAPGASVQDLGLSLNIVGSYESLNKFMRSLEKSSRIFEITSISFGASADTTASTPVPAGQSQFQVQQIYSFNLELKTYSY